MKKLVVFAAFAALFVSCGENKDTDLVESGTYQGKAEEVDADEKEIYVRTADNKLLELYFTDKTTVTKGGEPVDFSALSEGGKLR